MNREQKVGLVASLKEEFAHSNASFLINFRGLTVDQVQALRKDIRSQGGRFKVAKARLIKMAAQGISDAEIMQPYFKDQIGVVFAKDQAHAIAKSLHNFAKQHEAFSVIAGSVESNLLDLPAFTKFALLLPREVQLAQLCGVLQAPGVKLLFVLKALQEKLAAQQQVDGEKSQTA